MQVFLELLGGLALFLYGMELLGDALKRLAGGETQRILAKLTTNRARGFLVGALATAAIQSSSATVVMLLGFIQSGMMSLSQASGVIFGANVGTTITAWLLSGTGAANALNPSAYVPLIAAIGIGIHLFSRRERARNIGSILLSFSVLMFGMQAMSGAAKPLAGDERFLGLFQAISNPAIGFLVGVVSAAALQSSSAAVGILQAISTSGALTVRGAIPILMGQCVGASAPVMISAIGAEREGKRTALFYLTINLFGAAIGLAASGLLRDGRANPLKIAELHTGSRILMAAILLPLSDRIEALVDRLPLRERSGATER